jgi:hypothetical protein
MHPIVPYLRDRVGSRKVTNQQSGPEANQREGEKQTGYHPPTPENTPVVAKDGSATPPPGIPNGRCHADHPDQRVQPLGWLFGIAQQGTGYHYQDTGDKLTK